MDSSQSVNLKLCLYGGREATIEKSFDQTATLNEVQQEMRQIFNVGQDRETKLWLHSSTYTFKPTSSNNNNNSSNNNNNNNNNNIDNVENDENNIDSSTSNNVATTSSSNNSTQTTSITVPTITVATNSTTTAAITTSNTTNTTNSQSSASNNGIVSSSSNVNNHAFVTKSTSNSSSSPIKPPPTPPPPMQSSSSNSNSSTANSATTKQEALTQHNDKSAAVMEASTSKPSMFESCLMSYISDQLSSSLTPTKEPMNSSLADVGVTNSDIVTLEVINNDGTWPSSRPRYGTVTTRSSKAQPGLCGLSNMGNTCFMNSALQCLSNTPPLTNYILTDKFLNDINTNNPLGMHGEIARTYAELIKVMWSGNHGSFLPREFKCAVSRFAPQFTGFAQQDCQELMAFLLDGLHEDLNRIRNKPYIEVKNEIERRPDEVVAEESWANYKRRNDSIVVDTFHAMLKSTLVCPECKLVSVTFDPFCYLSLPLPVKREKQVNLVFQPAPGPVDKEKIKTALKTLDADDIKTILNYGGSISYLNGHIEEHGGYADSAAQPMRCKLQVPRTGPASELCEIVARTINDERGPGAKRVEPNNLVIAELAIGGISKIYESNEHYNQLSDGIIVIEKRSNYVLPLYLKERKMGSSMQSIISEWLFLHVPDLKYETLYKSIISSLSNLTCDSEEEIHTWCKFTPPSTDVSMECDVVEDESYINSTGDSDHEKISSSESNEAQTNGKETPSTTTTTTTPSTTNNLAVTPRSAFDLCFVNSFGTHSFETIGPTTSDYDYSSKLYLGVVLKPETASSPQFSHTRRTRSDKVEPFTPKVSPKPTLQLKDCITQFTNAERLGADDPWYCPKCKKHQQAIKKFDIWSLPKVLIIHLKRFSFSRSWRDKIDTLVEFPVEDLDMSKYVHCPEQKDNKQLNYSLIGVANHFGGLGGGHYTAYAKNAVQDTWYSFDDALVTPTSPNNVVTRSAYVLFYQLKEEQSTSRATE